MDVVKMKDIEAARERIGAVVKHTPVLTCSEANRRTGRNVYFKAEHLQTTGSFKIRGASNATLKIKELSGGEHPGVVTQSSGNGGQAMARAATIAGLSCTVIIPGKIQTCKREAMLGYGAELVECVPHPSNSSETESVISSPELHRLVTEATDKVVSETGKVVVSGYDHPDVIAGQGTIGLELVEQIPDLDAVLVSVGGGGLSAGIAVAVKALKPNCKIYLVTPEGKMMEKCLRSGERLWPNPPQFLNTIADGIIPQQAGHNTFQILKDLAEKDVFEVSDDKMVEAMKFCFHRMKQVIEASAGASVAALFSDKMATLPTEIKNVAVILCGGNTDIDNLPWCSKKE